TNLAVTLGAQGKYAEAEAMQRRALAIRVKALGEDHPDTARSYTNLGSTLRAGSQLAEAEAMHRRAVAIWLAASGAGHPETAAYYDNLAWCLDMQDKADDALEAWSRAAASREHARMRGTRGLEAAFAPGRSPLPALALALARA